MRLTETLQNRTSREPSSNRALNPDFGFIESTVSLMERGADDESVVGTLKTLSSDFSLQYNSSKNGSKNLEEEEWKKMMGENTALTFRPGYTKEVWDVRRERSVTAKSRAIKTADAGMARQLIAGSIGSMGEDAILMFTPAAAVLGKVKKGADVIKKGNTLATPAFLAGNKSAIFSATKQVAMAGARQETLENAFIYVGHKYQGDARYGLTDLALDTLLQFPLRTAMGVPYIAKTAKHLRMNRDLLSARASIQSAYANGDVGHVTQILAKYDEELDLTIKGDEEIAEIVSRGSEITPDEAKRVTQFLIDNQEKVWLQRLAAIVPFDSRLATEEMKDKHQSEVMEAVNMVMEGRREELSSEQLAWVTEADADVQKAFQSLLIRFDQDIKPIGPDGNPVVDAPTEVSRVEAYDSLLKQKKDAIAYHKGAGKDLPLAAEKIAKLEDDIKSLEANPVTSDPAPVAPSKLDQESVVEPKPAPSQEKIAQTINDAERSVDPKKVAAEKREPQVKEAAEAQTKGAAEQAAFDADPVSTLIKRISELLPPPVARLLNEPLDLKNKSETGVTDQMQRKMDLLKYLDENFEKADPIHKEYSDLFDEIFSFYGYMGAQRKQSIRVLKDLRAKKPISTKLSDNMFMRLSQMVADGDSDLVILSKMDALMQEEQLAFAMRSIHDFNVRQRHEEVRGKAPSTVLKYLQSYMDGTIRSEKNDKIRRTIHTNSSVDAQIKAQITLDQMPILEVLHETGFYDLFMGAVTGKYTDAYRFDKLATVADQRARKIYGENLEQASNAFIEDLMAYARTGQVPVTWKDVPEFMEVAKVFKATPEGQVGRMNQTGANIHMREFYSGLSQRWDEVSVKKQGWAQWRKDMMENIDWEATKKMHGGKLHKNLNDVEAARARQAEGLPAEPTEWVEWDDEAFLKGWWTEMGRPVADMDHASMDIARSMSKSRRVILKADKEAAMLKKYSGHKSLGRLYVDQVRYRSEMLGVSNSLGNQPIPNFNKVMESHGIEAGINNTREGFFKDARHASAVRHLSDTVKMATGALDNPVDKNLSNHARQLRLASNILYLPKAGISALNDVPGITSTLKYQGVPIGMLDMKFWASYMRNIARRFNGNRDEMSRYYLGEAAGMDSFLNAQSARFSISEGGTGGELLTKLNESLFNMNFLNLITSAGQDTYIDLLSMDMGRQIVNLKKGDQAWHSLNDFGFSPQEIADLGKYVTKTADGVERISSQLVPDPELSRKLREYQIHYMNSAVITPDLGTQATVRMGQQDGTWRGVAARNVMQYMSFPLATSNIHFKRYINGYDGSSDFNTRTRMMGHMSGWIGGAMVMGYVSMVMKDLAAGREPMFLHNMTAAGIGRVYNSSGVGGVLDPLLGGLVEREVPIAPLVTLPFEVLGADSGAQALHRARPIYGSAYPFIGPTISMMMGTALGDALPLYYEQKKGDDFFERKYNQGKFLKAAQNY